MLPKEQKLFLFDSFGYSKLCFFFHAFLLIFIIRAWNTFLSLTHETENVFTMSKTLK